MLKIFLKPEFIEVAEDVGTVEFTLTVTVPGPMDPLPLDIYVDLMTISGTAGTFQLEITSQLCALYSFSFRLQMKTTIYQLLLSSPLHLMHLMTILVRCPSESQSMMTIM